MEGSLLLHACTRLRLPAHGPSRAYEKCFLWIPRFLTRNNGSVLGVGLEKHTCCAVICAVPRFAALGTSNPRILASTSV